MSRSKPVPPAPERGLGSLLDEVEALLRGPAPAADLEGHARLARAVDALERAAARAPGEARRHARRLEDVRARFALRTRDVPPGALDGLYEAVRARTLAASPGDLAWRRAGMSHAFLDAPHALARWRRLAVAACALIAVGAGLVATRQVQLVEPGAGRGNAPPVARGDPRDGLLRRRAPARADAAALGRMPGVRLAPSQGPRGTPLFTFTVRPRREWDAGRLLDVVPAGAAIRRDGLEKN